jgi:probable phosphomutase (TIGR03848 family)
MPTVLLVRHGQNQYVSKGRLAGRLPGVHLNDKGKEQAQTLAKTLSQVPIKAVYASPLDRTLETAAPIAEAHRLEVIPRAGLLEVDFGAWQDKTLKELRRRKLWKVVQGAPARMRFPEGESFAEAQLRIANELDALCRMHKPKDVFVCVGHSDMIKLAVAYYTGVPLDQFQRLMVSTASISTLHIGETSAQLINFNLPCYTQFKGEHNEK